MALLRLSPAILFFPRWPASHLHPRVPSRPTLVCLAATPKVPLPIASPASLGDDPSKWDPAECDALLRGGEQVASVLQEMLTLMEDIETDGAFEPVAVELVAQGVIGKRVDEMESGFLMALDYMIQLAQKDADDERKSLLEVIKQTVLDHLTKKCPPHVQVVGLLCQTEKKESRHELLRRVAAGGGVFKNDKGLKCQIPGANLNDIANQADDLVESMESRDTIPDRKLLARLVIVREEARNMMGGGLLDERNDRGLTTLPEAEVNFLSKLVALKPGKALERMIMDVMHGKGEGTDNIEQSNVESHSEQDHLTGVSGMIQRSVSGRKPRPVRPGMFLETVSKVLGGVYASNTSGITAQHLEWVHRTTLKILEEMAF
ncbi:protein PEP-RELATED DEVELOPMENT ARRESTED 1 homolog, chloroplastic-like isoform X1 [Phragmites australis]|uniref:protein PEP-RELATED DEVELOPMENT ARRESTED 1 homolog, chloroplastic-like isoform X1 n=1 Tax=Phragmites australis TaxID=29695 RepID=UPI002D77DCE4|nr:protein PEP-RELATED DEVELOPMENT ARRESTED 1 homolog, chloroplastic-like isoform X1 [Phragmites australis]